MEDISKQSFGIIEVEALFLHDSEMTPNKGKLSSLTQDSVGLEIIMIIIPLKFMFIA